MRKRGKLAFNLPMQWIDYLAFLHLHFSMDYKSKRARVEGEESQLKVASNGAFLSVVKTSR